MTERLVLTIRCSSPAGDSCSLGTVHATQDGLVLTLTDQAGTDLVVNNRHDAEWATGGGWTVTCRHSNMGMATNEVRAREIDNAILNGSAVLVASRRKRKSRRRAFRSPQS